MRTSDRRRERTAGAVPWQQYVRRADCVCDDHPCLYHYALELDWRERTAARARAGVREGRS